MTTPISNFPNGVSVFGLPVLPGGIPATTGKVFFVSNRSGDNGSNGNDGLTATAPFNTLATAVSACTAGRGDVIIVMPGHAETISTTVTPVAGSAIIGLGWGRARPVFTGSGAIAVFTVSNANVMLRNIVVVGAAASVDAHLAISGADAQIIGCEFVCAATPLHSIDFVSGAARCLIQDCVWSAGTSCAVDYLIRSDTTTATGAQLRIINCYATLSGTSDIDNAIIRSDKISFNGMVVNGLYVNGVVGGDNVTAFDFNWSTDASADGMLTNIHVVFDAAVTAGDILDAGGMNTVQALFNDVVSATGARFPTTTAS